MQMRQARQVLNFSALKLKPIKIRRRVQRQSPSLLINLNKLLTIFMGIIGQPANFFIVLFDLGSS